MINNLKQSNNNINWFDDKWKNAGSYHWWKPRLKEIAGELKADDPIIIFIIILAFQFLVIILNHLICHF